MAFNFMENTKDLTKGSPYKLILVFAIPVFISNLFQQLYNVIDSLIVGNFIGDTALAAVSSSGNLIFLFTSFITGTATGCGIVIGRYFGSKDTLKMRKGIHTSIAFGLVSSVILSLLGVFLSPILLKIMRTDEEVLPSSISYFRNYFIGVTGVIMFNIFSGILQALGNSRRPLYYLIFASILNVILDLLFVAVFKMGVGSASIATAISQISSATLCLIFLSKKNTIYQVRIKEIRFDKEIFKEILKYGIPSGVQNSVIALANVLVQSNINTFGKEAMAGCGTYSKIEGFAFLPINCFTLAISNYISQNLGAKEYDRAKKGSRFGIICSVSLSLIIGTILFLTVPILARLFSKSEEVNSYTIKQMRTISLFYPLLSLSHSIASVCRGAGKAIVPMFVMLFVWCFIRILYIEIAMHINHNIGLLFIAYPLTWFISSIIFLFYYFKSDWIHGFENRKVN